MRTKVPGVGGGGGGNMGRWQGVRGAGVYPILHCHHQDSSAQRWATHRNVLLTGGLAYLVLAFGRPI